MTKRKALFLFCHSLKKNIYFFQQTYSSNTDERFCQNQWGGKVLFSHCTNHSGGVAVLFERNIRI